MLGRILFRDGNTCGSWILALYFLHADDANNYDFSGLSLDTSVSICLSLRSVADGPASI